MYELILRQMQDAARAGHVRFTSHAFDELDLESLTPDDAVNCILTGDIIDDQYDLRWQQIKYVLWGDTIAGDEMGLVARWDDANNVFVITAFRLTIEDYD